MFFRLGDELQLREPANLFAVQAWLAGEGKRLQRPSLGQIGASDAPLQRSLLLRLPLRAHQARDEVRVADVNLVGGAQLFVIDFEDAPQLEILQQLFQFFSASRFFSRRCFSLASSGTSPYLGTVCHLEKPPMSLGVRREWSAAAFSTANKFLPEWGKGHNHHGYRKQSGLTRMPSTSSITGRKKR
jgi:hypothetical protein